MSRSPGGSEPEGIRARARARKTASLPRRRAACALRMALGLSVALGCGALLPALGDVDRLYERIAAGSLVIHGRCQAGGRRATVHVLEVMKGEYAGQSLFVSYRTDNYNRTPGTPRIDFEPGRESIFVLEPERDDRERLKGPDRFQLVGSWRGKIDLPPEGAQAYVDAARRLAVIQALRDQMAVWSAQRSLIREPNPLLVTAGFEEILKFRLGDESLAVPLVSHLDGPRPEFRRQALRVIGQMFARQRRTGTPLPSTDLLAHETLARATGDELPETRAEAVRALRELGRTDLADPLARLASKDPSQMVRYEAELALLDLRKAP